jgi:hypothetical protein
MNNRVRELIKLHGSDSSGKWVAVDKVELIAELIVRECASVVSQKTGPKSALNVLEHFGVEE